MRKKERKLIRILSENIRNRCFINAYINYGYNIGESYILSELHCICKKKCFYNKNLYMIDMLSEIAEFEDIRCEELRESLKNEKSYIQMLKMDKRMLSTPSKRKKYLLNESERMSHKLFRNLDINLIIGIITGKYRKFFNGYSNAEIRLLAKEYFNKEYFEIDGKHIINKDKVYMLFSIISKDKDIQKWM